MSATSGSPLVSFTYWGVVYRPKNTDHGWADWGDWVDESTARREAARCRERLPEMEVALRKVVKVVEYLDV